MSSCRMERGRAVVALAIVLTWAPAVAVAQQENAETSDVSFKLGTRAWVTTGNTKWNFQGPLFVGGPTINPLSELRWRGVDSVVPEVNAELVWKQLVLRSSLGWGGISEGVLIDDDFLFSDRQGRWSHTRSNVNDDGLFYVNADIGLRLIVDPEKTRSAYTDLLIGYQYWHEKYVAFGATGFQCTAFVGTVDNPMCAAFGAAVAPPTLKVITHDYFWHSLRIGQRTKIPLYSGLSLKADAIILPWSSSELRDVHHLRNDLKQNPSFLSRAKGGFGVQLDGGLTWATWWGLSIEGGFQYWRLDSGEGDKFTRALSGTTKDKLNEIIVERYGPYLGLQYRF